MGAGDPGALDALYRQFLDDPHSVPRDMARRLAQLFETGGAVAPASSAGNGGMALTATFGASDSVNVAASIGGTGGEGGTAGTVDVTSSSIIQTAGYRAHGIYAESVGGGGGTGGSSGSLAAGGTDSVNLSFAIGGTGGTGNTGNTVTVNNIGSVTAWGEASHAIFAQSVGGGGGVIDHRIGYGAGIDARFGSRIDRASNRAGDGAGHGTGHLRAGGGGAGGGDKGGGKGSELGHDAYPILVIGTGDTRQPRRRPPQMRPSVRSDWRNEPVHRRFIAGLAGVHAGGAAGADAQTFASGAQHRYFAADDH